MIQHQERIIAVKDAIKPGIIAIITKPFEKYMLKEYLRQLKQKDIAPDKEAIKKKLIE